MSYISHIEKFYYPNVRVLQNLSMEFVVKEEVTNNLVYYICITQWGPSYVYKQARGIESIRDMTA